MVLIDMGLYIYGLYIVINRSKGLISQDFSRLGSDEHLSYI